MSTGGRGVISHLPRWFASRFFAMLPGMEIKTSKQLKVAQKIATQEKAIVLELQEIVNDIERSEKTITSLKSDLDEVNAKHASRQTTQDDIHYLEDLLSCAKKKLV